MSRSTRRLSYDPQEPSRLRKRRSIKYNNAGHIDNLADSGDKKDSVPVPTVCNVPSDAPKNGNSKEPNVRLSPLAYYCARPRLHLRDSEVHSLNLLALPRQNRGRLNLAKHAYH